MRIFIAGVVVGVALAAAFIVGRVTVAPSAQAAGTATLGQVVAQLKKLNVTIEDMRHYDQDILRSLDDATGELHTLNTALKPSSTHALGVVLTVMCRNTALTAGQSTSFC
jgi:hypothetical protein